MGNKLTKNQQDILSPTFIYDFGAPVWRMKLDTATDRLALEVRDGDVLLACFYSFDCRSFALAQLNLQQQTVWWQGLEDAQDGLVFLHGYGDRKLGQHKGITARTGDGTQRWEEQELAFYGIGAEGLYAFAVAHPEEGFQLLDLQTGQPKEADISQQAAAAAVADFFGARYNKCVYPVLYLEGEPYFLTVQAFLADRLGVQAVKGIEYAETNSCILVSYYLPGAENKLANEVAVFDLEGNLLLSETLAAGLSGIGSDTFFIFKDSLYFIQNKTILQVYLLPV
ncbi:DUF4905 domain-containing protein [Botryobacter ruber]|uniref:DUF4905 domain-containing protein n=1 Tax=Botryobacter ruber TaxID=2171629 RepID=UPI001F0BBDF9|nr:DUF4905 domain-containing protein [Botryobacter ruber]